MIDFSIPYSEQDEASLSEIHKTINTVEPTETSFMDVNGKPHPFIWTLKVWANVNGTITVSRSYTNPDPQHAEFCGQVETETIELSHVDN